VLQDGTALILRNWTLTFAATCLFEPNKRQHAPHRSVALRLRSHRRRPLGESVRL